MVGSLAEQRPFFVKRIVNEAPHYVIGKYPGCQGDSRKVTER
jgi:hypothetical protein